MSRFPRWLLVAVFAAIGAARGAPANTSDRISFRKSGITIVCDRQDEAFARKFAERLPALIKLEKAELAALGDLPLSEFKANRKVYLATIAHYLGLKKPTKAMRQVFDRMLKLAARTEEAMVAAMYFDTVQIWREPELVVYLRDHGDDEYFALKKKDSRPVAKNDFAAHGSGKGRVTVKFEGTTRRHAFLPVILKDGDSGNLDAQVIRLRTDELGGMACYSGRTACFRSRSDLPQYCGKARQCGRHPAARGVLEAPVRHTFWS